MAYRRYLAILPPLVVAIACGRSSLDIDDVLTTAQSAPTATTGTSYPPIPPPPDAGCVPVSNTETKCDGIDDDCNGVIDDVPGQDGICGCVRVGLMGAPGHYSTSNFEGWLQNGGTQATRFQDSTGEALDAASLAKFDVVILDWLQRDYTADEVNAFDTWLSQGHGLLALSGFSDDYQVSRPNGFLAYTGMQFSAPDTFSVREEVTTFFPSPITAGIHDISFVGGSRVNLLAGTPAFDNYIFATLDTLPVGVSATPTDTTSAARAVAWGDEFIEFDSEWGTYPDIRTLWVNLFQFLAPKCVATSPPPH